MTYQQYLQLKELYKNDRNSFEKKFNNKLYELFVSPNRFFDVFLEKDLSETQFNELRDSYTDQRGLNIVCDIADLEYTEDEEN